MGRPPAIRISRRAWLTACLPAAAAGAGQGRSGGAPPWAYHEAYGGTGRWEASNHQAAVRWSGDAFEIDVVDASGRLVRRISGRNDSGVVSATMRTPASDAGDEPLRGTYASTSHGALTYEVFALSNRYRLVGLSRARTRD